MGTVQSSYYSMLFTSTKIYLQRLGRNHRPLPIWTICDKNCEDQYFHVFTRTLPLLKDVPLNVRESKWFQHEGTLPQLSCQVRNWLNNHFSDTQIGSEAGGWPIVLDPYSHLNPFDFYFMATDQRKHIFYGSTRQRRLGQSHLGNCDKYQGPT
jgi:hypothetical protein